MVPEPRAYEIRQLPLSTASKLSTEAPETIKLIQLASDIELLTHAELDHCLALYFADYHRALSDLSSTVLSTHDRPNPPTFGHGVSGGHVLAGTGKGPLDDMSAGCHGSIRLLVARPQRR